MTTDNFCFYLQNRLIQTSQTGPPLVFPGSSLDCKYSTKLKQLFMGKYSILIARNFLGIEKVRNFDCRYLQQK